MKKLDEGMVALSLGLVAGSFHLVWALLVMLGMGQSLLDWIFGVHFLNNPYTVMPFNLTKAIMLVVFTFVVGYVVGWAFVWVWNMWAKKK